MTTIGIALLCLFIGTTFGVLVAGLFASAARADLEADALRWRKLAIRFAHIIRTVDPSAFESHEVNAAIERVLDGRDAA